MGIMEGRDARRIYQKFDALYKPALLTNWQVWPMAQVSRSFSLMITLSTLTHVAHQFSIHAAALQGPIPVNVRCLLDSIPIYNQLEVSVMC